MNKHFDDDSFEIERYGINIRVTKEDNSYHDLYADYKKNPSNYQEVKINNIEVTEEQIVEILKHNVREKRNVLLKETDTMVSVPDYPIDSYLKERYKTYRTYLRDFTEMNKWWEHDVMTFNEWCGK